MPYEVYTEWSANVISWSFRYSITQEEIADRSKISISYLSRLLHMQKPYLGSCKKVDNSMKDALEARGFDSQKYLRQQRKLRSRF